MSVPTRSFDSSARPQTDSTLLQLPVEVRIKILQCLMKSPNVISPPRIDAGHRELSLSLSFSSQLLRCCQQLFIEGGEVLYGQNTVQIVCSLKVEALNGSINLPYNAEDLDNEVDTILDWAVKARDQAFRERIPSTNARHVQYIPPDRALVDHFITAIPAMLSFERLEILVDCHGWHADEQFYIACRALKSLVRQKNVTLNVVKRSIPTSNHCHVQDCYTWDVGSCQIWDCKTLTVNTDSHGKLEPYLRQSEQQELGYSQDHRAKDTSSMYQDVKSLLRLFCECSALGEYDSLDWSIEQEDTEKCWELTSYMVLRTFIFKYDLQQAIRQTYITLRRLDITLATRRSLLLRDIQSYQGNENYIDEFDWYTSILEQLDDHVKIYETRRDSIKEGLSKLALQFNIDVDNLQSDIPDSGVTSFGF